MPTSSSSPTSNYHEISPETTSLPKNFPVTNNYVKELENTNKNGDIKDTTERADNIRDTIAIADRNENFENFSENDRNNSSVSDVIHVTVDESTDAYIVTSTVPSLVIASETTLKVQNPNPTPSNMSNSNAPNLKSSNNNDTSSQSSSNLTVILLASIIPTLILISVISVSVVYFRRKKRRNSNANGKVSKRRNSSNPDFSNVNSRHHDYRKTETLPKDFQSQEDLNAVEEEKASFPTPGITIVRREPKNNPRNKPTVSTIISSTKSDHLNHDSFSTNNSERDDQFRDKKLIKFRGQSRNNNNIHLINRNSQLSDLDYSLSDEKEIGISMSNHKPVVQNISTFTTYVPKSNNNIEKLIWKPSNTSDYVSDMSSSTHNFKKPKIEIRNKFENDDISISSKSIISEKLPSIKYENEEEIGQKYPTKRIYNYFRPGEFDSRTNSESNDSAVTVTRNRQAHTKSHDDIMNSNSQNASQRINSIISQSTSTTPVPKPRRIITLKQENIPQIPPEDLNFNGGTLKLNYKVSSSIDHLDYENLFEKPETILKLIRNNTESALGTNNVNNDVCMVEESEDEEDLTNL